MHRIERGFLKEHREHSGQCGGGVSLRSWVALAVCILNISGAVRDALADDTVSCPDRKKAAEFDAQIAKTLHNIQTNLDSISSAQVRQLAIDAVKRLRENPITDNCIKEVGEQSSAEPGRFAYRFGRLGDRFEAGFFGQQRVMELGSSFDPQNPEDVATLMHEAVHVGHDDRMREEVPYEQYRQVHSMRGVFPVVLGDEAEGISVDIETLNILTDGKLNKQATSKGPLNFSPFYKKFAPGYFKNPACLQALVRERYERVPGALFFTKELERTK